MILFQRFFRAAGLLAALLVVGRCAAATVTWDGGGDGVRWNDPANWTGDVLPGATDDAVVGAGPEVRIEGAAAVVNRATVRRPLRVVSGGLTTTAGLGVDFGSLILDGGLLQGPVLLVHSGLVLSPAASSAEVLRLTGSCTLDGDIPAGLSVTVLGSSAGGHTRASWQSGGVNRGTLRFDSVNAGWWSRLEMGAIPLVNDGTGRIVVVPGAGGSKVIVGSVRNSGTWTLEADVALEVNPGVLGVVEQIGGSIDVAEGSRVEVQGGSFTWDGGQVSGAGRFFAVDSRVQVTSGVTQAGTVVASGSFVFLGNDSPVATLLVEGNSRTGHTTMRTEADAVNRGELRFDSRDAGWWSRAELGNFRLSNAVTGRLLFRPGAGGFRGLSGTLANAGRLEGESDSGTVLEGSYEGHGGLVVGDVRFLRTALSLVQSPVEANQLTLDGSENTLRTDVPAGYTLHVRGGGDGHAFLRSTRSFRNAGTLLLKSQNAGWISAVEMQGPDGFGVENLGRIVIGAGSQGPRWIRGDLTNRGVIQVEAGVTLEVQKTGGALLEQAAGSIEVDAVGALVVEGGTIRFTGGRLAGPVYAVRSQLDVPVAGPEGQIIVCGDRSTLVQQKAPGVSLWVQGGGANAGSSRLQILAGAVNQGLIRMESVNAGWISDLLAEAGVTLENGPTGRIVSAEGSGGRRAVVANLRNAGRLEGVAGNHLAFVGAFTSLGGFVSPEVEFIASTLDLGIPPEAGSTFFVAGDRSRLVSDVPAGTTLRFHSHPNDGHSTLIVPQRFANRGRIEIASEVAGWTTTLFQNPGGEIRNEPGAVFQVQVGAGGRRVFPGRMDNLGELEVQLDADWQGGLVNRSGATLRLHASNQFMGAGTAVENFGRIDFAGSVGSARVAGTFRQATGGLLRMRQQDGGTDRLMVDETAHLDGALELALLPGASSPLEGQVATVIQAGVRLGRFGALNLPALASGLSWNPEYTATSLDLRVVARDPAIEPVEITRLAPGRVVPVGTPVVLDVGVRGTPPISYQWYRDGGTIGGATAATLDLGLANFGIEGNYRVEVSNAAGRQMSDPIAGTRGRRRGAGGWCSADEPSRRGR